MLHWFFRAEAREALPAVHITYPIGIQNFAKLREEGYVYIDKTDLIYRLVTSGTYYFLSRPRRFGKSLLISTMEALFANTTYQIQGDAEKNF